MQMRTLEQFIKDEFGDHSASTTLFCKEYKLKSPTVYKWLESKKHFVITIDSGKHVLMTKKLDLFIGDQSER